MQRWSSEGRRDNTLNLEPPQQGDEEDQSQGTLYNSSQVIICHQSPPLLWYFFKNFSWRGRRHVLWEGKFSSFLKMYYCCTGGRFCTSMSASLASSSWLCRQLFRSHCKFFTLLMITLQTRTTGWRKFLLSAAVFSHISSSTWSFVDNVEISCVSQLVSLKFSLTWYCAG